MAKTHTAFFCQNCGAQFSKWQGQCTHCKEWNTLVQEVLVRENNKAWESGLKENLSSKPQLFKEINLAEESRLDTGDNELNRVLGGGLVPGSVTLLGGEPGIGKSTLLLQLALRVNRKTLYISGEESERQLKLRAQRIGITESPCYILAETQPERIFNQVQQLQPELLIIDSVQTLHADYIDSSTGSVSQIRECSSLFVRFAKETHVPVILVGHITKDGQIAGPKILEHMVDVVLQFEGDRHHLYRILRAQKNRYGSTSDLGIYEMQGEGLIEVSNPSDILVSQREEPLSGHAVAATLEGMRPLMIEVQALVSTAVYGTPQRSSTGFNSRRLNMLLAVLEKRAGFRLGAKDVFLNLAGGITLEDPALDLAVIAAILSSNEDVALPARCCFAGEIGLSGEIRPSQRIEQRYSEAEKLGYKTIILSKYGKLPKNIGGLEVISVGKIEDVIQFLF